LSDILVWLGIAACLSQSATLSGLNLAVFTISRLRLETAAEAGDADAKKVLSLRRDANFTLATILWANVAVNVLLALLAESVMAGVMAFLFATVVITMVGEIMPQAYFTRHALRVGARLTPLLRAYRLVFWPVARPVGKLLDRLVGPEGIDWLREKELRDVLWHHASDTGTEVGEVEARGAINFLVLDDVLVKAEGEPIDPRSIISLAVRDGIPEFPDFRRAVDDEFLRRLESSGKKWVVITDGTAAPRFVVDAHAFLRDALFGGEEFDAAAHCRHPLIVRDRTTPLGQVLGRLTVRAEDHGDDVIDTDLILVWTNEEKRIITGSDVLGRLLRGIARVDSSGAPVAHSKPEQGRRS